MDGHQARIFVIGFILEFISISAYCFRTYWRHRKKDQDFIDHFATQLHDEVRRYQRRGECCWHQKGCPEASGDRKLTPSQMKLLENLRHWKMLNNLTAKDRDILDHYESIAARTGQIKEIEDPEDQVALTKGK